MSSTSVADSQRFARTFCGGALILGGVLVLAGFGLLPVRVEKHFEAQHIDAIAQSADTWVLAFRLLVFGLFVRLMGLVAMATLDRAPGTLAVMAPAVAVCSAGLMISATTEGYFMDLGFHAIWRFSQEADPTAREAILKSFWPTGEWVSCLGRMGMMFLCFGTVEQAHGQHLSRLVPRPLGWVVGAAGLVGMMGIFLKPGDPRFQTAAFVALAIGHLALGAAVLSARAKA